jgi:aspartyl protease family protein
MNQTLNVALMCAVAMVAVGTLLPRKLVATGPAAPAASARVDREQRSGAMTLGRSVTLQADAAGHFHADAEIEGRIVPMLVDTGASVVALRPEDAAKVGLSPMPSDYKVAMSTANGVTTAAEVRIRELRIGGIAVRDVRAVVMQPGLMSQSLLGMSFLKALGRVQMGSRELVIEQ